MFGCHAVVAHAHTAGAPAEALQPQPYKPPRHTMFVRTQLAQVRVLLEAAAALAPGVPAIIAGDFNSAPASGVHRFCRCGSHYQKGVSTASDLVQGVPAIIAGDCTSAHQPQACTLSAGGVP